MKDINKLKGTPSTRRRKRVTERMANRQERFMDDDVRGLHLLPDGPSFVFQDVRVEGKAVGMITIGASSATDIALTGDEVGDPTISAKHCYLKQSESGWSIYDCNSTNHTVVNDVVVEKCKLHPGSVITLGQTHLVAFGPGGFDGLVSIVGFSLHSLIHKTHEFQSTYSRSAAQIGVPRSTLIGWLKRKFKDPPERDSDDRA